MAHHGQVLALRPLGGTELAAAVQGEQTSLYKQGMRRLAGGVSIIAAESDGQRCGMVATAVTSVSAEPPTLLVCVARGGRTHQAIRSSGRFCVNVLNASDEDTARRFAGESDPSARFSEGEWSTLATGAPALSGCLVSFDCVLSQDVSAATHSVFFGRVVRTQAWAEAVDPLLFWDGGFRTAPAASPHQI